jgi:hypothetical protein
MQITSNSLDTDPGPSDWCTGSVFIDAITAPTDASRFGASWHTHPHGQTICDDQYGQAPSITGEN